MPPKQPLNYSLCAPPAAKPGRMEEELVWACKEGDFSAAGELISKGADPNSARDGWGWSPLHYACKKGKISFVKTLVEKYSCDCQCKSSDTHWKHGIPGGSTPLHLACRYVIELLNTADAVVGCGAWVMG